MQTAEPKRIGELAGVLDQYLKAPTGVLQHPDCSPSVSDVAREIEHGGRGQLGVCRFCGNPISDRFTACQSALALYDEAMLLIRARQSNPGVADADLATGIVHAWQVGPGKYEPKTDIDRLPDHAKKRWEETMSRWIPGVSLGFVIHGDTGAGKTRLMFLLLRKLWMSGHRCVFTSAAGFGRMIEDSFSDKSHSKLIERLGTTPILAIDDLGKEKTTDRVQSDLFEVLNIRTTTERPTIFTTQYVGETMEARFTEKETGKAFVRRMRMLESVYLPPAAKQETMENVFG